LLFSAVVLTGCQSVGDKVNDKHQNTEGVVTDEGEVVTADEEEVMTEDEK